MPDEQRGKIEQDTTSPVAVAFMAAKLQILVRRGQITQVEAWSMFNMYEYCRLGVVERESRN